MGVFLPRLFQVTLLTAALAAFPARAGEELEPSDPPVSDSSRPAAPEAPAAAPAVPALPPAQPPAETSVEIPGPSLEPAASAEGAEDVTIEVDEGQSRNEGKSLPLAMLFSAVLPGGGELYLQEKQRAKTFLLVEAGFWASLYVAWLAKESYLQSARNAASTHAGIDAGGKSENFLETMEAFRSYQEKQHRQDSYELAQILSGKREQDYDIKPLPGNYWDFGSSANPQNTRNWRDFQSAMRFYRGSKVAMSFAVGALALNRLGSLVNTLQTYKRTSTRSAARLDIVPDLGPEYAGTRLTYRF